MSLSSLQLDAFLEVARTGGFSKAARNLHLTQSALSQRILNLEEELGVALLVRQPGGVRLTERGEELLRYCQLREGLEQSFLARLEGAAEGDLAGVLRIGGYSTVMRSVVLPSLSPLVQASPQLQIECVEREMREMPDLLRRGEVDFVLLDREITRQGWKAHVLGQEEYVLVGNRSPKRRREIYLDHDPEDTTTEQFFRAQEDRSVRLTRSYLDEIYAIIDGVKLGWGRAVVPRHLITEERELEILGDYKPLKIPVVLHYYEQPYYSRLHQAVVRALVDGAPKALAR